jgi:hypothetical protein
LTAQKYFLRGEWIKNAPAKPVFQGFMGANTQISPQNDSFAAFKVFGIQPFFQKGLAGNGAEPHKGIKSWKI